MPIMRGGFTVSWLVIRWIIRRSVPTYAIWSRNDGVIAIDSARGHAEESDRMVELECGHFGFAYVDEAVNAVIDCVVEAEHLRHESAA